MMCLVLFSGGKTSVSRIDKEISAHLFKLNMGFKTVRKYILQTFNLTIIEKSYQMCILLMPLIIH